MQVRGDDVSGNRSEIEALATGDDGGENLVGLGGREDEFDVRRRLFECFEESVEGTGGEHVDLIDVNDAEAAGSGGEANGFEERADFVDLVVGGAVDFQDVERAAFGDLDAGGVIGIEVDGGTVGTIQGL